jgi:hypothetical protein
MKSSEVDGEKVANDLVISHCRATINCSHTQPHHTSCIGPTPVLNLSLNVDSSFTWLFLAVSFHFKTPRYEAYYIWRHWTNHHLHFLLHLFILRRFPHLHCH